MSIKGYAADEYFDKVHSALYEISSVDIEVIIDHVYDSWKEDIPIFLCGNGGSSAISNHLATDLTKGLYKEIGKGANATSLTDSTSSITAFANDCKYKNVFVEQIEMWKKGIDEAHIILFSVSGTSKNILSVAKKFSSSMNITAITGSSDSELAEMCDQHLQVPSDDYGIVEDCFQIICHMIVNGVVQRAKENNL